MRFFLFLLWFPLLCYGAPPSEQETLFIRRIQQLWSAQELVFAKNEIEDFLTEYPNSSFAEHAHAILGDIALKENSFSQALAHYNQGSSEEVLEQTFLKRCLCLYQLDNYPELNVALAPHADAFEAWEENEKRSLQFFYAESLFRPALILFDKAVRLTEAKRQSRKALPHYMNLKNSEYHIQSMWAVAEITRLLGNAKEAARHYLSLAAEVEEGNPQLRDQLLFQGARMLSRFDVQKGIDTFAALAQSEGPKAGQAAFEWLLLLGTEKQYKELLEAKPTLLATLPKRLLPRCHIHLGWAHFESKHYPEALYHFEIALQSELSNKEENAALLALIVSAKEVGDRQKLQSALAMLQERHPDNEQGLVNGKTIRAMFYLKQGETTMAEKELMVLLTEYQESTSDGVKKALQNTSYQLCKLLLQQSRFEEARIALERSLERGEEKKNLSLLPVITLKQLARIESFQDKITLYKQLSIDLKRVLKANVYSEEERLTNEITLARCYLALSEVKNSEALLLDCLTRTQDTSTDATIYYLLSLGCLEMNDPKKTVKYGEKALKLDDAFKERRTLHLNLFNAYLSLDEKKGARHLFKALKDFPQERSTEPISLKNLIWLANHNFNLAKTGEEAAARRAIFVFEHMLGRGGKKLTLSKNLLFLEPEVLKLATLYNMQNSPSKQKTLLEEFYSFQQMHPDWAWENAPKTALALATLYTEQKEPKKATALLQTIDHCSDSATAYTAALALARLKYQKALQSKDPDRFDVRSIIKTLSFLVIRKVVEHEPVHLEAALDRASIQASLFPKEEQKKHLFTLLKEVKLEFSQEKDIQSKDYHAALKQNPAKEKLYLAYMRYIDASLLWLDAELSQSHDAALEKRKAARALLSTLNSKTYPITPYLKQKIESVFQ